MGHHLHLTIKYLFGPKLLSFLD